MIKAKNSQKPKVLSHFCCCFWFDFFPLEEPHIPSLVIAQIGLANVQHAKSTIIGLQHSESEYHPRSGERGVA